MYSTIIFDLDGTLLNTIEDLAQAGNHTLSVLGFPNHPTNDYKQFVGNGIPKLIERMLPEKQRGISTMKLALSIFENYYGEHMMDYTAPYKGIQEMLLLLSRRNISMAVATNKSDKYAKNIVEKYFPSIFDIIIGVKDSIPPKPDPTSTLQIIDLLGADKSTTLYCGDSNVDMLTAQNANLDSCGVTWGFRTKDELESHGATFIANKPSEIIDIVLSQ